MDRLSAPAPAPDLRIVETRVYRGPNIWSYGPAIHLLVDLGSLEDFPTDALPGFTDQLLEWLPGVGDHFCSRGRKGGFAERLREGTWAGHVAEHVALQLQNEAGHEIRRGKTRSAGEPGRYNVVYGYQDEDVALAAGDLAVRIVNHLVAPDPEFDFHAELEDFLLDAQRTAFGPSTQALVDEATARDIPWMRLNSASLVQLGQGCHAQRIRATMTSLTSALGVDIASDKEITNQLLEAAGLPVPHATAVKSLRTALRAAHRIGWPVVIKPLDGNHGRGVGLNITSDTELEAAFDAAAAESRDGWLQVESHITGNDYRVLVVGGKVAAVAERVPAHVIGDGIRTIRQLVDDTNADPRRGVGHEKVLTRIKVDDAAVALVAEQGFAMDDVPPRSAIIKFTLTGNMSTGGISIDRTFDAHPDNIDIAEEAARVVGLDVAGIDFITPDISQPVREIGGAICEVNAAPGFRMHTHPTQGEPQYVAKPVMDLLFPPGTPSRVPIIAVTGTNGKTTTSRMIAHVFKGMGRKVGMTSTDGVVIDERLIIRADASGPKSARMVLQNPRVDMAVLEVARGGILREGLGYDRNDVAVVLNVASDHLGLRGINSLEDLADVKSVVVEAVPRGGHAVLNADDTHVLAMADNCAGDVIWFSAAEPGSATREMIDRHCDRGGIALVLEKKEMGEAIVLREGSRAMQLSFTHLLPATFGGKARFNILNSMAAAGACYAAGAHLHDIRAGLRTFSTSYHLAPGRLNQIEVKGVQVFVDYAHNPAGLRALGEFVAAYADGLEESSGERPRRRIGVIGTAGDRRDEDMIELGEVAVEFFDVCLIKEDRDRRGRSEGEVSELIAVGAGRVTGRAQQVEIIRDELVAVRTALEIAEPGDVVAICAEETEEVYRELEALAHSAMHE
ncbi:MAG: cyanophycin synthetase [Candidatus Nanopelagicales bacterium]